MSSGISPNAYADTPQRATSRCANRVYLHCQCCNLRRLQTAHNTLIQPDRHQLSLFHLHERFCHMNYNRYHRKFGVVYNPKSTLLLHEIRISTQFLSPTLSERLSVRWQIFVMDKPALAPPLGIIPNFVDPYTLEPVLIVITVIYLVLTTLGVGARLIIRKSANKSMLLEDC